MKIVRPALAAGMVAAFFVAANSVLSQARPHQRLSSELQNALVSQLTGMTVENSDGERLGKVKNFVINRESGEVKYAIISSGGLVGVGSHLRIVPAKAVSTATTKKEIVLVDISKSRWAKAPAFKKSDLAALNDPAREQQLFQFYSKA